MIMNREVTVSTVESTLTQGETEVRDATLADKNLDESCGDGIEMDRYSGLLGG